MVCVLPEFFLLTGARRIALSPCGRGHLRRRNDLAWVRGWLSEHIARGENPSSGTASPRASPRHLLPQGEKGRRNYTGVKNGSGAPSVGLNTTLTFWPIFSF